MAVRRGALLLVAAVLPGLASAGAWPQPTLPAGTQAAEVSRHIVFNGLDMHAQVFKSSQSQAQVVAFYRKLWDGKVVVNSMGAAQVIGHKEGDYYVTVQVSEAGSGSKGNIGIVDIAGAPKRYEPGKGLPRPMGTKVFNDIAYPDDPTPGRTVAMRNRLSTRQNEAYFRERLAADGWKPADQNRCASENCVLRYVRGDSRMTLVMTPADGQSQVMINLMNP
ncbi:hypothetical protein ACVWWQ_001472 [Rhodanobacter sp. TND4EL1]